MELQWPMIKGTQNDTCCEETCDNPKSKLEPAQAELLNGFFDCKRFIVASLVVMVTANPFHIFERHVTITVFFMALIIQFGNTCTCTCLL